MPILKFSLTFLLDIQLFYSFHSARDQNVTISFFPPPNFSLLLWTMKSNANTEYHILS